MRLLKRFFSLQVSRFTTGSGYVFLAVAFKHSDHVARDVYDFDGAFVRWGERQR